MRDFPKLASELFMQGCSCSESVVQAAYETGLLDRELDPELLNQITSPFSQAMGTHQCLCGAVAGSQIVLGLIFGRKNTQDDPHQIKNVAKSFVEKFKAQRKVTCCGALSGKFLHDPTARRANCTAIVGECAALVQEVVREKTGISV